MNTEGIGVQEEISRIIMFRSSSGLSVIMTKCSAYHMLLRMKNNWMKMHPNGRMPPMTIEGNGFVYIL